MATLGGGGGCPITGHVEIASDGFLETLSQTINSFRGLKINLQLVSIKLDPETQAGKRSPVQAVNIGASSLTHILGSQKASEKKNKGSRYFPVQFDVAEDFGSPGIILLDSEVPAEFFLESISLQVPGHGNNDVDYVYFPARSWINQSKIYPGPRIFFSNQAYLPSETPEGLKHLRKRELEYLRGDGTGERKKGERIYDYDVYNNLGNPDKDADLARPVLGGSSHLPYPRRCRTGGKHTKTDTQSEVPSGSPYLPRDEIFSSQKSSDITKVGIRTAAHQAQTLLNGGKHFTSLEEISNLYAGKLDPDLSSKYAFGDASFFKFPPPGVAQANKNAWMTDEEFARQRLAGMNPMQIRRLERFPPRSTLDASLYGHEECKITEVHLEGRLEGLTVEQALDEKRLYILDYHDSFITPYVAKINETEAKIYASRTLFFLTKAGLLLPVAIELNLPPTSSSEPATKWTSRVFTPPASGQIDWVWQLAKAHVAVVDAAHQHLCSHWLKTHACMEPFIIATRRHLSAMHPINMLLSPHFKDTLSANSAARQSFLNAGGRIEQCFATGKYSNEVSSIEYKRWRFDEQAVPNDLIARGMGEPDEGAEHGVRLYIEDYPYAQDALELWTPIKVWAEEYVSLCYEGDETVARDEELQAWWKEVREVGHGDHKQAPWWGGMASRKELGDAIATLIWMATGLHAVVDFGQYPFMGYMPNGPTMAMRHVPEEGGSESIGEKHFLESLSLRGQATTAMGTFETTSQHMSEEAYLGGDGDEPPSADSAVAAAHRRFKEAIAAARDRIQGRISAPSPHRAGPSLVPFALLLPFSQPGLTGRGVPNSISI